MKNLDVLLLEYEMTGEVIDKYFSYMYSIMNFTFVFYGGVLAVFHDILTAEGNQIEFILVILYLLPCVSYVLGLFYAYNSLTLYRLGSFIMKIEADIVNLEKRKEHKFMLHGWQLLCFLLLNFGLIH